MELKGCIPLQLTSARTAFMLQLCTAKVKQTVHYHPDCIKEKELLCALGLVAI